MKNRHLLQVRLKCSLRPEPHQPKKVLNWLTSFVVIHSSSTSQAARCQTKRLVNPQQLKDLIPPLAVLVRTGIEQRLVERCAFNCLGENFGCLRVDDLHVLNPSSLSKLTFKASKPQKHWGARRLADIKRLKPWHQPKTTTSYATQLSTFRRPELLELELGSAWAKSLPFVNHFAGRKHDRSACRYPPLYG